MARSRDTNGTGGGASAPGILQTPGFWNKPKAPARPAPASAPARQSLAPSRAPAGRSSAPTRSGNNASGNIAPVAAAPAPAPVPPPFDPNDISGDATYKSQSDQLAKAWKDYQNNQLLQTNQYGTDYAANTKQLGISETLDKQAMTDDYASRGLLESGVYGKAFSDLLNQYQTKQTGLDTGKADFGAQLGQAAQNFQSAQGVTRDTAKQDAINRRAALYGL